MQKSAALTPLTTWLIWFALFAGLVFQRFFLGSGLEVRDDWNRPLSLLEGCAIGLPFAVSLIIRWSVLPRLHHTASQIPFFIIGIAAAEMIYFLGLFLFNDRETIFFATSALTIALYCPATWLSTSSSRL